MSSNDDKSVESKASAPTQHQGIDVKRKRKFVESELIATESDNSLKSSKNNSENRTKVKKHKVEEDSTATKNSVNLSTNETVKHDKASKDKTSLNTSIVAEHYNTLEEKGCSERFHSRIVYMRNFNNWIKSILLNEYIMKIKDSCTYGTPLRVLDMCCGKGGDLFKWKQANISHLICADIAGVSVKQCEGRYNDIVNQNYDRSFKKIFSAEFITADCTKVRLREKYKDASIQLDLVSCQFALHYSFESFQQAECMMRNASENLKPGGYFIATIPNATDLVYQWRQEDGDKFGNDIYNVKFCGDKNNIPLFGAKYNFHLEEVVDCPEFLVYLPVLKKLALKFGLEFLSFERFNDCYKRFKSKERSLLSKMQALETYPSHHGVSLRGKNPDDYQHAIEFKKKSPDHHKIGTLTLSEWDAISLYGIVAFKKLKRTWNAEGKAEYSK